MREQWCIQGKAPSQYSFIPECLEEVIGRENPVRFIPVYVESLDIQALGFTRSKPAGIGRPSYGSGEAAYALPVGAPQQHPYFAKAEDGEPAEHRATVQALFAASLIVATKRGDIVEISWRYRGDIVDYSWTIRGLLVDYSWNRRLDAPTFAHTFCQKIEKWLSGDAKSQK